MNLVRFDKRNEWSPLFRVFDDFWGRDLAHREVGGSTTLRPAVNVVHFDDRYEIEVAAPGLEKNDFQIKIEKDILNISVEKQTETEDKNGEFTRREFGYSSFKRSFHLPETLDQDKVDASYHNGILRIKLYKLDEAVVKASRTIAID
jgi:HSP20 family protein